MSSSISPRYDGKPLLRLLECYALKAISQLPKDDESKLEEMTSKLAQIYQYEGKWFEIIAFAMKLPDDMQSRIVETWRQDQEIAKAKNLKLTPQQFVEMFVSQNLS